MKKTIFIKLLVLCFIGIVYLPFFHANVKADSIEQEIIVEGVEEGKTYGSTTKFAAERVVEPTPTYYSMHLFHSMKTELYAKLRF